MGLTNEQVIDILNQLCRQNTQEFELCLWSGTNTFLYITREDYRQFEKDLKEKGKVSLKDNFI